MLVDGDRLFRLMEEKYNDLYEDSKYAEMAGLGIGMSLLAREQFDSYLVPTMRNDEHVKAVTFCNECKYKMNCNRFIAVDDGGFGLSWCSAGEKE